MLAPPLHFLLFSGYHHVLCGNDIIGQLCNQTVYDPVAVQEGEDSESRHGGCRRSHPLHCHGAHDPCSLECCDQIIQLDIELSQKPLNCWINACSCSLFQCSDILCRIFCCNRNRNSANIWEVGHTTCFSNSLELPIA